MLRFLFRAIRKIKNLIAGLGRSFTLYKLKILYPKRIFLESKVNYGKFFSIIFDDSTSNITIGTGVQFRDNCQIRSGMHGRLAIGDCVFFNNNCTINCFYDITVGNDCQFGEGVKFYDMNHRYKDNNCMISEQGYNMGKIVIGSNCWFGSNVVVLKDVTIGDNVVIGANCLIYASIPSNSVVTISQSLVVKNRN